MPARLWVEPEVQTLVDLMHPDAQPPVGATTENGDARSWRLGDGGVLLTADAKLLVLNSSAFHIAELLHETQSPQDVVPLLAAELGLGTEELAPSVEHVWHRLQRPPSETIVPGMDEEHPSESA